MNVLLLLFNLVTRSSILEVRTLGQNLIRNKMRVALTLIPLLALVACVSGNLNCLRCDTNDATPGCSDGTLKPTACPQAAHEVCFKTVRDYKDGTRRVIRGCKEKPTVADSHKCLSWNDIAVKTTSCLCPIDGCNAANANHVSLATVASFAATLLLVARR